MTFVRWAANLSVHDETIDAEHRGLIDDLNRLNETVERGNDRAQIGEAFERLIEATGTHFHHEEETMRGEEYPDARHHRNLHAALIDEIEALRREFMAGEMEIGLETMDFLKSWLVSHILESDKQLGAYLQGRASGALAASRRQED